MITSVAMDTGYLHVGCTDKAAYRCDRRADKQRYQHDRKTYM